MSYRTSPCKKLQNKSNVQLVSVNILLIAAARLTFPWINKIFYVTVWFVGAAVSNLLALWAHLRLLQLHCAVVPLCWHLDHCLSPSPSPCCLYAFVTLFSLSAVPPRPCGSPMLLTALSFSLTLSSPHHTSSLWCLSECQAGRPWSDLVG